MPQHLKKSALCYVIMPFSQELRGTYDMAIKPAVSDAASDYGSEIRCLRADDLVGPGNIKREIIASIHAANVVIADLTGNSANVFYELGVSHSMGNKTIMISQSIAEVPFDVREYRLTVYEPSSNGLKELRNQLSKAILGVLAGQPEPTNPVQDFAPVANVIVSFDELVIFEGQSTSNVWIIEPALDADLKHFRNVIKNNIENRAVQYRYLVPNTKDLRRSVARYREALGVDDAAWQRISIRTLEPYMVESEVTIYDALTDKEKVLIMSPLEEKQPFWISVRGSRAKAIRDRYEALWDEVSKPLVEATSV